MLSYSDGVVDIVKSRYAAYYHTADPDAKGRFYSTECMQICRPNPSYSARDGASIVRFLKESAKQGASMNNEAKGGGRGSVSGYTFRPLRENEFEFETDEVVAPIDTTSFALEQRARNEGWVGTRVDMWFPMSQGEKMLVKVRYWWRKEADEWVQILHDIMYLGPLDGTEGTEGEKGA
jgi:hypothetical protein